MNIPVNYIDTNRRVQNLTYNINRLAFAKHLAIAGQGYEPSPRKLFRTLGMFLHYSYYLQRQAFNTNHFSTPPDRLYDPTEKGQFTTLVGKAIADFLVKRINNAVLTVGYESEMYLRNIPIIGERPDLLAFLPNGYLVAIEAKGRTNGPGNMNTHKLQAASGPIPVAFSVACVSFGLYHNIRCNYHDPINEDIRYTEESLRTSSRNFYKGFYECLNMEGFSIYESRYRGEDFYEIGLSNNNLQKVFGDSFHFPPFYFHELLDYYRPRLLIPKQIKEFAEIGIGSQIKPFEVIKEDRIYVDNDRIGIMIR
jgi:hypothetical protein